MMKHRKKNIIKMLTAVMLMLLSLGMSTSVFASSLVGKGTTTHATTAATTTTTATAASGTAASGTTTSADTTLQSQSASVNTTTAASVSTGYFEDAVPYMIALAAGMLLMAAFYHLLLNQLRLKRTDRYESEMEEFRERCRI